MLLYHINFWFLLHNCSFVDYNTKTKERSWKPPKFPEETETPQQQSVVEVHPVKPVATTPTYADNPEEQQTEDTSQQQQPGETGVQEQTSEDPDPDAPLAPGWKRLYHLISHS